MPTGMQDNAWMDIRMPEKAESLDPEQVAYYSQT